MFFLKQETKYLHKLVFTLGVIFLNTMTSPALFVSAAGSKALPPKG